MLNKYPDISYVIYKNAILDITKLIHPGGRYVLDFVKGREISRFIYGAYKIEKN